MNLALILGIIGTAIQVAKQAVEIGQDAGPVIAAARRLLGKDTSDVTQQDLDDLVALSDALSNELMAPLPPEEPAPGAT